MKNHLFDLVVIGGGVHGAAVVRRLAKSGYDVVLVEKGDFCSATSANSLKILHGGLRYLQHGDFKRMRESIRARREFMQLAPHLVKPLPCLMATQGMGLKSRPLMGTAFFVNDLISFDRNQGLPVDKHLGRGRIIGKRQAAQILTGLDQQNISGAALWYDGLVEDSERMVLVMIKEAVRAGAAAINYAEVEELLEPDSGSAGYQVKVRDSCLDERFTVRAKMVVDCGGPWRGELADADRHKDDEIGLAKAVNIVVDRNFFGDYAVGIEGSSEHVDKDAVVKRGKRLFFFVPWRKKTMIGTMYRYCRLEQEALTTTENDIGEMLAEINDIYPAAGLTSDDVVFSHAGLVPAHSPGPGEGNRDPRLVKHSEIIDHDEHGRPGLISIRGVKYTTALQVARDLEQIVKAKGLQPSRQEKESKESAAPVSSAVGELEKSFPHIRKRYGREAEEIYKLMAEEPSTEEMVSSEPPLCRAEICHMIRSEMVLHLSDLVLRRSGFGSDACPERKSLEQAARVMADELDWPEDRVSFELDELINHYRKMHVHMEDGD
ncbi:MAG: FAD-dependent oxidoreductase [Thermodesulfobacteriota bacterium]